MKTFLSSVIIFALLAAACKSKEEASDTVNDNKENIDKYYEERIRMVENQIERRGIEDSAVLDAMRSVPRHLFVPEAYRSRAYEDGPLPIGNNQTISQPYIVALMTELLDLQPGERVLEVGTGSGYQAAVLAEIADSVYTIEIVKPLADRAGEILDSIGYNNIKVMHGDGYQGYEEAAPYDAIIVTAAPDHVPQPLIDQLAMGGRLVIPVGSIYQYLTLYEKTEEGLKKKTGIAVRFVPMTGKAQEKE
jgi:protein-L-isoaspartate(D-aspartate) O-methyltransferase